MKKISVVLTIIVLLFTFNSVNAKTNTASNKNVVALQSNQNNSNVLLKRLEAIKEMDKSKLNKQELKNLLTEVRSINTQLKVVDGGIFISAGALIVILIVLLFLL